ncbi:uncharacterized protein [Antedon mediterranea]|uniref:uncharacterized protein n=1 Tax=Antedon mediterranea TaxID=105859 RepID=UPI003AF82916
MGSNMLHRFIEWIICITLFLIHVESNCPTEITCNGVNNCYVIYTGNNDWYYYHKQPGNSKHIGGDPPSSASSYVLKRLSTKTRSPSDIERECQEAGAKTVVINNDQEYDQLTHNIIHILSTGQKSSFYVKVGSLQGFSSPCGKVTIEDGFFVNEDEINEILCNQAQSVNDIVCESISASECPEPTTITPTITHPSSSVSTVTTSPTTSVSPTSITLTTSRPTVEVLARETTRQAKNISVFESENQPIQQTNEFFTHTFLYIVLSASFVVLLVVIGITCFLVKRRKKKRKSACFVAVEQDQNTYGEAGEASVSLNVASETIQVHLDNEYQDVDHRMPNQDTNVNQKQEVHYKVPKEQNVYESMPHESGYNREKDSKLEQGDAIDAHVGHYSIPRKSVDKYTSAECIYQEPDLTVNNDIKNSRSVNEIDDDKCNSKYHEPSPLKNVTVPVYDLPKPKVKQEDSNRSLGKQNSLSNNCENEEKISTKPHTPMKPPSAQFKSKTNTANTDNKKKAKPKYKIPSTYDIHVPFEIANEKKDNRELNSKATAKPCFTQKGNQHNYISMDKNHEKEERAEQYYTQESVNQYENYFAKPVDCLSSNYDVPRKANEYETCDDMEGQKGQSDSTYDVPRLPNEYESCDDNMNKERAVNISNAFYEALEQGVNDSKSPKESGKKKTKSKPKTGAKPKSQNPVSGYMSYDSESHDDHYQELDKSAVKIIKFR